MKYSILLFSLSIFLTVSTNAQWSKLSSGTSKDLYSIHFIDQNKGWVAGEDGTIKYTDNAGSTWSSQTSGLSQSLNGIYFASAAIGYAVGEDGKIIKTDNGGGSWWPLTSGTTKDLYDVWFYDLTHGIAVGESGCVVTTSDGGASWNVRTSGTSQALVSVQMTGASQIYICGTSGVLIKSTDAGSTWNIISSNPLIDYTNMHFPSSGKGYLTFVSSGSGSGSKPSRKGNSRANAGVYVTDANGNLTLKTINTSKYMYAVYFADDQKGLVAGEDGRIYLTKDGGDSWVSHTTASVDEDLYGIQIINGSSAAFAAGKEGMIARNTNITGLKEIQQTMKLNVYPNPAQNDILVSADLKPGMDFSVMIVNQWGQAVHHTHAVQTGAGLLIPVSHLPTGTYILKVSSAENQGHFIFTKN